MRVKAKPVTIITTALVVAAATIAVALVLAAASSVQARPSSQDATGKIYWTEYDYPGVTGKLVSANRDGSQVETLLELYYGRVGGIAFDIDAGNMYLSVTGDRGSGDSRGEILRANLDGSGIKTLLARTWVAVTDIALDVTAGKIYWTTFEEYVGGTSVSEVQIQRANFDGSQVETLASERSRVDFSGIALDTDAGHMYWTRADKIQRANLDGSGVETLASEPALNKLALDVAEGKMYWTGGGGIRRANLDGSEVETLAQRIGSTNGIDLDIAAGKMYWANYSGGRIQRANLDGTGYETLVAGLLEPYGIALEPMPTSTPTPTATPTPTTNPTSQSMDTTPIGGPTVNFHASQTEVATGEPVVLTLSVANSIVKPEMTLQLVLQLPSGVSISGEGLSNSCSVQCSAIYQVPTGQNRDFLLTAVPNQSGSFEVAGRMEWYFGDDTATYAGKSASLTLNAVKPLETPTPAPSISGEPTVNLHATQTEVEIGEPVVLTLVADNSIAKPQMTLKFILQVPSGWSMSGTGFTEACSGQCTATYQVRSGEQKIHLSGDVGQPDRLLQRRSPDGMVFRRRYLNSDTGVKGTGAERGGPGAGCADADTRAR